MGTCFMPCGNLWEKALKSLEGMSSNVHQSLEL